MPNTNKRPTVNYYGVISKNIKKRYNNLTKEDISALCREVAFAPDSYQTEINGVSIPITNVREILADMIEISKSEEEFIPYSLDAAIADLIEENNCETSSMNEYYRWISWTADIVRKTSDGEITHEDLKTRKDFIAMSWDREAELMLCLALYQAGGEQKNADKILLMRFKLARLREMRSIVRNTEKTLTKPNEIMRLQNYLDYCRRLLAEKIKYIPEINQKLKLNTNDITDEDLNEGFSFIEQMRSTILYMMRRMEKNEDQSQRSAPKEELQDSDLKEIDPTILSYGASER